MRRFVLAATMLVALSVAGASQAARGVVWSAGGMLSATLITHTRWPSTIAIVGRLKFCGRPWFISLRWSRPPCRCNRTISPTFSRLPVSISPCSSVFSD